MEKKPAKSQIMETIIVKYKEYDSKHLSFFGPDAHYKDTDMFEFEGPEMRFRLVREGGCVYFVHNSKKLEKFLRVVYDQINHQKVNITSTKSHKKIKLSSWCRMYLPIKLKPSDYIDNPLLTFSGKSIQYPLFNHESPIVTSNFLFKGIPRIAYWGRRRICSIILLGFYSPSST